MSPGDRQGAASPGVYDLMRAALEGAPVASELLRRHPELADARTEHTRETALHYLAIEDECAAVTVLLDLGVAVDPRDSSESTPLVHAAQLGYTEMVRLLLGRGADPNVRDFLDETPLHKASQAGAVEIMRLLIDGGADASATTDLGETVLGQALPRKRARILALLRSYGIEPDPGAA